MKRLKFITLCLSLCLLSSEQGFAVQYEYEDDAVESTLLEHAYDLQALAQQAHQQGKLIVLAMSTDWCEYCDALEQQVLEPMLRSGDFEPHALLRKIVVDDITQLKNFHGERISSSQFAIERKVNLYPTLLFVDTSGAEAARRIVGITVLEFAADDISRRLRQASQQRLD